MPTEKPEMQGFTAPAEAAGKRLDAVAATLFSDYSRSRLQGWIKQGLLRVNGEVRSASDKLIGGEEVSLVLPADAGHESWENLLAAGADSVVAEPMALDVVHSDDHIFVINKSVQTVMHPAPGHRTGTLMNGLLHLDPGLRQVPRAGIVHRLDKDTSGLCVVARTLKAHKLLVDQLQQRSVTREYLAVALGEVPDRGTIDEPIGRHPKDRKKMAVVQGGKPAVTHFEVVERFTKCALVKVKLETGRTHQIRVHMTHLGHALLGDSVYQHRRSAALVAGMKDATISAFNRQALHAKKLGLIHPGDGTSCEFLSEPPADFAALTQQLRKMHNS